MADQPEQSVPDVRKSVTVAATPEHCFKVFTERPEDWWPPTHVLLKNERVGLAFEPGEGGRYYEWDAEGNEIDWGRVLTWEPPRGLSMTWRIDGRWQSIPDDERASEIEVTITPVDAATTRVELAHVKLHRHGPDAQAIHRALDGPSPGETLELFAKAVQR
ncbi:SRPBCC family protein [Streptomyces nanhaiensis]|uniref:SRPBCC family protein n=1 Tax=Streptomyces nanhaiensis TaxID=679319 RepID=UPI00399CA427